MQGRHGDMVHFADYIYSVPCNGFSFMPSRKDVKWEYINISGRCIDRNEFEEF